MEKEFELKLLKRYLLYILLFLWILKGCNGWVLSPFITPSIFITDVITIDQEDQSFWGTSSFYDYSSNDYQDRIFHVSNFSFSKSFETDLSIRSLCPSSKYIWAISHSEIAVFDKETKEEISLPYLEEVKKSLGGEWFHCLTLQNGNVIFYTDIAMIVWNGAEYQIIDYPSEIEDGFNKIITKRNSNELLVTVGYLDVYSYSLDEGTWEQLASFDNFQKEDFLIPLNFQVPSENYVWRSGLKETETNDITEPVAMYRWDVNFPESPPEKVMVHKLSEFIILILQLPNGDAYIVTRYRVYFYSNGKIDNFPTPFILNINSAEFDETNQRLYLFGEWGFVYFRDIGGE